MIAYPSQLAKTNWDLWGTTRASAGGYKDQTLRVWDAQTGKEVLRLKDDGFWGVVWSPDGRRLATSSSKDGATKTDTGDVKVWDSDSGKEILSIRGALLLFKSLKRNRLIPS